MIHIKISNLSQTSADHKQPIVYVNERTKTQYVFEKCFAITSVDAASFSCVSLKSNKMSGGKVKFRHYKVTPVYAKSKYIDIFA